MSNLKNDCNMILNSAEDVLVDLGHCIHSTVDKNKTKMNVVGSIYRLGKSITKLTFNTGYCAIKNTPKAVVAVASVKRELVHSIEKEIHHKKLEHKKDALDVKIKRFSSRI